MKPYSAYPTYTDEPPASFRELLEKIRSRNPNPTDKIAESTRKEYFRVYKRYEKTVSHDWAAITNKMSSLTCSRTWYKDRAALIYVYKCCLETTLEKIKKSTVADQPSLDKSFNMREWLRKRLECLCDLTYDGPRHPPASKRKLLKKLPRNWRELIYERTIKYKEPLLVMTLCGCRPSELVKKVLVEISQDRLIITLKGSKVTGHSGQEWREIHFLIQGKYAEELAEIVKAAGGRKIIGIESAANFSSTITSAGKREPSLKGFSITAYCYRHQLASDLKLHMKLTSDDDILISKVLGHLTSHTKKYYGFPRSGKSMVSPIVQAETSRPIKMIPHNPPYHAKRSNKPRF